VNEPAPPLLWQPRADARATTRLGAFIDAVEARTGRTFGGYDEFWQWSVDDLAGFWQAVWDELGVHSPTPPTRVLDDTGMPGTRWFPGASVNYAAHALRRTGSEPALIGRSELRPDVELSWDALRDQVARARAGLVRRGVGTGDRVAAYLPNIPETIVVMLAAASLGAIWTSCAPEFGPQAVLDRFRQVEPKVLLGVTGYRYGGRDIDRSDEFASIRAGLPTVTTTVVVPYAVSGTAPDGPDVLDWNELLAEPGPLEFAEVADDHPLYVLYSSGTTGMPKAIVHGHLGITLEHLKVLALHADMGPSDRFLWFTTTGWMMWNYLVSGLLVGATVVTFDGDPAGPDGDALWAAAAEHAVTWLGVGAPFLSAGRRLGLHPAATHDLSGLRALGATGAPLPADAAVWAYEAVLGDEAMLSSVSGGTDVCSAFVGGSPLSPVWAGEISCRYLGAAVEAYDPDGTPVRGREGELVITQPMPSMPLGFWGDADGSRYRAAYFDTFPGVWRHGDWVTVTDRGSCVISGRADATLNRGGVRVGTAEIYRVVESVDGVADSLVVHLEDPTGEGPGVLVLFVAAVGVGEDLVATIRTAVRRDLSPRHVPDEVHVVEAIPTTLSGKKLEVPVKRILLGAAPDTVASADSLRNPAALAEIVTIASSR